MTDQQSNQTKGLTHFNRQNPQILPTDNRTYANFMIAGLFVLEHTT